MLKAVSWFINGFEKYINFYVYMHFIPTQPQTGVTMFLCSNRDKNNYNGIKAELCQRSIV